MQYSLYDKAMLYRLYAVPRLVVPDYYECGVRERSLTFLKNCGWHLSRGFGLRSFRPKLTNLNILRIGKSVFVFEFVFVAVGLHSKSPAEDKLLRPKSPGLLNRSGRKLLRLLSLWKVMPPQFFLVAPPPPLQS